MKHFPISPKTKHFIIRFKCQYLNHFSTNWAEIFSGNPLVDDSNIQTTKKFKLQLDASIRNFVSHFFLSPIMSETFPHITQNISPYHQKAPFFLKFWFLTANISAISQPIELNFFLVTLQWVIAMSRLQKILSSS